MSPAARPPSIRTYAIWIALVVALSSAVLHLAVLYFADAPQLAEALDVALAAAAGIAAAAWLAKLVSRPLRRLEQVARAVAAGDRDQRAEVSGPRECADAAQAFNALLDDLSRTVEENEALALYMQRLSRHALALRAMERKAIATELHDRVGQNLAAAQITIRAVRDTCAQLGAEGEAAARHLATVEELLKAANERTRNLMVRLRPPLLDEYGIATALQAHARQLAERGSRLRIVVTEEGQASRLEGTTEGIVFEVLVEALHNAEKHADTDTAYVAIRAFEDRVEFTVQDEGRGFDPEQRTDASWGIPSMRERIGNVGGRFELHSEPGAGTDIRIVVPQRQAAA